MSSYFPEVCIAFLLSVTISVTTASAEQSFSKLKLINTYLRNSMGQERLPNIAILSIENSMARNLDFDIVITLWLNRKPEKGNFNH